MTIKYKDLNTWNDGNENVQTRNMKLALDIVEKIGSKWNLMIAKQIALIHGMLGFLAPDRDKGKI